MSSRGSVAAPVRRARIGVSVVFAVCGAGFATWASRVPAAQARLDLSAGQLAVGLFGLAAGSVLALLAAGPLIIRIGSRRGSLATPGRAIAAVATCGYLGFLVGPVLVGALATAIGLASAVLVAGVSTLVVVALAPSLRVSERSVT